MVVFTDVVIDTVKKNLLSMNERATLEKTDAISAVPRFGGMTDLFFVDPPYADFGLGLLFVKKVGKIAKSGAILIWEFESNQPDPKIDTNWEVLKDKTYGRARFLILVKK